MRPDRVGRSRHTSGIPAREAGNQALQECELWSERTLSLPLREFLSPQCNLTLDNSVRANETAAWYCSVNESFCTWVFLDLTEVFGRVRTR